MSGKKSRGKGHRFEREIAAWFRRWFPSAATSRAESKSRDAAGVDLVETGLFNVQCKAVENLGCLHNVLAAMPDEPGQLNVVMHKVKRKGIVVAMSQDHYEELIELLKGNGAI